MVNRPGQLRPVVYQSFMFCVAGLATGGAAASRMFAQRGPVTTSPALGPNPETNLAAVKVNLVFDQLIQLDPSGSKLSKTFLDTVLPLWTVIQCIRQV